MAEINSFISPEAQKQIDDYIKSLGIINEQMTKLVQSFDNANKKTKEKAKSEQDLDSVTKECNKLLSERDKLLAQQDARLNDITKEVNKAKDAAKAHKDALKAEGNAYAELSLKHKQALATAKQVAAQYGVNSREAKKAAAEANKYGEQLIKINKQFSGPASSNVGKYFKDIVKGGLALMGIGAGFDLLKKGFDIAKQSIMSIQTTADKWNATVGGLKEGYNSFLRGIATGGLTFNEFIQNFRDAVEVGQEYANVLDDLADKTNAFRMAEADMKSEQLELLKISKDATKTNTERIAAIDKYIANETKLGKKRVTLAQQAYDAELMIAAERSDLTTREIEDYLKNYEIYSEIEGKRREEWEKDQKELEKLKAAATQSPEGAQAYMAKLAEINAKGLQQLTEEQKRAFDIIENASQLDDAIRDRVINYYEKLKAAEYSAKENTMKIDAKRSSMIAENIKEAEKASEVKIGIAIDENEMLNKVYAEMFAKQTERASKARYESNEAQKKSDEEFYTWLDQKEAERIKNETDKLDADLAKQQEYADKKKAIQQEVFNSIAETGNILFDLAQSQRDYELSSIQANYDARIQAAEGNADLQAKLAAELENEQNRIRTEQAKSERNQALFNVAMSTATGIMNAVAQFPLTGGMPFAAIVAAMGVIQAGAILATPIPQFFKGTSDTPLTFTAGERGSELMLKQDGSVELTPNTTTLYSGKEYQHAQIIPHAETQRLLAQNQAGYNFERLENKMDGVIDAIQKNSNIVNIERNVGRVNVKHLKRKYKWQQ